MEPTIVIDDAAGAVIGGVVHLVGAGGVRERVVPPVRVGLRHIVKPQVGAVAQQLPSMPASIIWAL